ncbi:MAG: DegT/DnrJ/EryC1/StrS family aminotransferase [Planctomycetota bacterium]|nr:DegT/DnrJ/EryC1/StrS family aminotransferase [Planctomycetota bacterium]MDA1162922.1 DegT/DnrJ/EryC1/StrS family aminotransferase [Planctomycetota bacterium]
MTEVIPSASPEPVPFIDLKAQFQTIRPEINAAVERVFESQTFVLGDEVSELEFEIAEYCDSRDAIGCASGSDALLLSLMGLDLGPGDEVITSPFTFFATAGAICRTGATPVFVDVLPDTYNIDPEAIEAAVTSKTRAIMPVHIFGQCADMDPIWRIATQHGLFVIEDACQAIGAEYNGRRAGVLGHTGCFSFFPTKNLGAAGDGGIITTDDSELAGKMRRLRVHGDLGGYTHKEIGFNSRLDALQAAVLRVKLRHLEQWTEARITNAARYTALCEDQNITDRVVLPVTKPGRRHVFNQYTLRVGEGRRDELQQSLREQQIGSAVYYPTPLHLQECFAGLGYKQGELPESERASAEVLSLPIFAELTEAQQDRVVAGLATALDAGKSATVSFPFNLPDSKAA